MNLTATARQRGPLISKTMAAALKSTNAAQGIAVVACATPGQIDADGEVIAPGAFMRSWQRERSKPAICWMHQWDQVCGGVIDAHEQPGIAPDGTPITQLIATLQFDVSTELGQSRFRAVANGWVSEYSVGFYPMGEASATYAGRPVRELRDLAWVEVSPVLRGAQPYTGTISTKGAIHMTIEQARVRLAAVGQSLQASASLTAAGAAVTLAQRRAQLLTVGVDIRHEERMQEVEQQRMIDRGSFPPPRRWIMPAQGKAGARNSGTDQRRIQAVHDTTVDLGATCAPGDA